MTIKNAIDEAFRFVTDNPSILEKLPLDETTNDARVDDLAIRDFAQALSTKMSDSRAKGRGGWQTCPVPELWKMLQDHVEKGDPRDVALLAMMIWHNSSKLSRMDDF